MGGQNADVYLIRVVYTGSSKGDGEQAVRSHSGYPRASRAVGGKLVAAYMTTGANDAVIISEAPDGSDVAAVELAIVASGAIARVETVRAWTMTDFKEIMEKGSRVVAGFKPPGS